MAWESATEIQLKKEDCLLLKNEFYYRLFKEQGEEGIRMTCLEPWQINGLRHEGILNLIQRRKNLTAVLALKERELRLLTNPALCSYCRRDSLNDIQVPYEDNHFKLLSLPAPSAGFYTKKLSFSIYWN